MTTGMTARRTTTRRTALAGLGALGVMTTAGACTLLPGLGGEEEPPTTPPGDDGGATGGDSAASDGGGSSVEPGTTFEGWASEEDLDLVELDTAEADAEFGTMKGQLEREDRYGTWWSPGFPEDSPVFRPEPVSVDPRAEEAFGGSDAVQGIAAGVLVQTILEILDTPLLLEADNSRSDEVGAALTNALGLEAYDESAFDPLFADVPVSGAVSPDIGLPEMYEFEPVEYPADGPRMSILEAATAIERLEGPDVTGPFVLASVRGALPVREAGGELPLVRTVSYGIGFSEDGSHVLMAYAVSAAPSVHIEDPTSLPLVEGTEVPEDWREHTVRDLTLHLPPELGEPTASEMGLTFQTGERRGAALRHLLSVPSPYHLSGRRQIARAEVPGADLAVAAVSIGLDSTFTVGVSVHREHELFSVQIHDLAEEEAPVIAHQLLAGLRLAS